MAMGMNSSSIEGGTRDNLLVLFCAFNVFRAEEEHFESMLTQLMLGLGQKRVRRRDPNNLARPVFPTNLDRDNVPVSKLFYFENQRGLFEQTNLWGRHTQIFHLNLLQVG